MTWNLNEADKTAGPKSVETHTFARCILIHWGGGGVGDRVQMFAEKPSSLSSYAQGDTIMDYTGRPRPGLPSGLSRGRPGGPGLPYF